MHLEIACFNVESALLAAEAGVDRIELCANIEAGGTTPDLRDFLSVKSQVSIPIYVMIRPRGGKFSYTQEELSTMQEQLFQLKKAGADGFVFGILDKMHQIAINDCERLLALADGIPCTFHRAIDRTQNIEKAFDTLIKLGFQTVLTSGGANSVQEGLSSLTKLQKKYGNFINIMPGGGIRSVNISKITQKLQTKWLHSSGIVGGQVADLNEMKAMRKSVL